MPDVCCGQAALKFEHCGQVRLRPLGRPPSAMHSLLSKHVFADEAAACDPFLLTRVCAPGCRCQARTHLDGSYHSLYSQFTGTQLIVFLSRSRVRVHKQPTPHCCARALSTFLRGGRPGCELLNQYNLLYQDLAQQLTAMPERMTLPT